MGQLQHLSENYYRVKHYLGSVDGKLKFEYHKQSPEYVGRISKQSGANSNIDLIGQEFIDLNLQDSVSFLQNMWTGGDLNPRPPECKSGVHTS
jgi:hypothetical protein